jgi:hypothetical protein
MPRCSGSKPDGTPCERIVKASQRFCYSHDPRRQETRSKASSKAGKARGGEITEVKATLREVADGVLDGSVDTSKGSVVAQLMGVLVRTLECERRIKETTEFAARLSALEELASTPGRREARW